LSRRSWCWFITAGIPCLDRFCDFESGRRLPFILTLGSFCYELERSLMSGLFAKGFVLGFSIAAPVGPIGLLCIRRTLSDGRVAGFVSGMGAASADAFYGCVAAFGLTAVSTFLLNYQVPIRIAGGLFLLCLGLKIFFSRAAERPAALNLSASLGKAFASTAFLTLTNPATILSFIAVFAGLGLVSDTRNYVGPGLLVLGVFLGSAFWWFLLSGGVGLLSERIGPKTLLWINRCSGALIFGLGCFALIAFRR
jgi:threonine/homoserine/homoserine lactone efflux protein